MGGSRADFEAFDETALQNPVDIGKPRYASKRYTYDDPSRWDCPACHGEGTVTMKIDWFCGEAQGTDDFECSACPWDSFIFDIKVEWEVS